MPKCRQQLAILFVVLIVINAGTIALFKIDFTIFNRFFKGINPIVVVSIVSLLGILILCYFSNLNWFSIHEKKKPRYFQFLALIIAFASVAIVTDLLHGFPKETNILLPKSLLFYPVIGFIVEILFHVFPLFLILKLATRFFRNQNFHNLLGLVILLVALLEPFYQLLHMPEYPVWVLGITGINLYVFNVFQLWQFKKYGFLAMYSARLLYYLVWHIAWGYYRLEILF